jgi:cyclase
MNAAANQIYCYIHSIISMNRIMKKLFFLFLLMPVALSAQRDWSRIDIEVTELAPGIHRLFVANSVAVVMAHGDDGVLLVDAAYEQSAPRLLEEMKKISDAPLRHLINTHLHGDHTGGNLQIGKGANIIAHASVREVLSKEQRRGEQIIPPFPDAALPSTFVDGEMELSFNRQNILLTHFAGGHTQGDVVVFFPVSKVLVLGDLLFAGYFPFVDISAGGHPLRFLDNVVQVMEKYPEDVIIVGGHGPVFNMKELRQWHNTLTETVAIIRQARASGQTAEQMKQSRILKNYEAMGSFFITEDRWIDTVYPFVE